jgi:hypothetical protein
MPHRVASGDARVRGKPREINDVYQFDIRGVTTRDEPTANDAVRYMCHGGNIKIIVDGDKTC